MIRTILDDLRKSFQEVHAKGGFYGLSTQSDYDGHQRVLRVYWRDYLQSELTELCTLPEGSAIFILDSILQELQDLRTLAKSQPTAVAA